MYSSLDLLRQITWKSICVPRLGLSVVCAAQAPRSHPCQARGCRAAWQRVQGHPGSCCALGCNCPSPVGLGWAVTGRWQRGDLRLLVSCQDPEYFSSQSREMQVSEWWHWQKLGCAAVMCTVVNELTCIFCSLILSDTVSSER